MSKYSQGICGDGAAILEDGQMMSVDSIVQHLNAYDRLVSSRTEKLAAAESQLAALKEENERLKAEKNSIGAKLVGSRLAVGQLKARVAELEHAANEWADACINGLQHLKNIRDGISLASAVIPNMEQCIEHCQSVWTTALKEPSNEG